MTFPLDVFSDDECQIIENSFGSAFCPSFFFGSFTLHPYMFFFIVFVKPHF